MVLVDTSVWVSHLRKADPLLQSLLLAENVLCHPFIIGELACGGLGNRQEILRDLEALPKVTEVQHGEILAFIEARSLMGRGIGLVDVHLLASVVLDGARLLTQDRRLRAAADELGVSFWKEL
jgi:predicted nucleic acid-binding protein